MKEIVKQFGNADLSADEKELFKEFISECIKLLKMVCAKGSSFQNLIVNTSNMVETLKMILEQKFRNTLDVELKCFQLIANLCVQNKSSQDKIWTSMSDIIFKKFKSTENSYVNVSSMIIYNLVINESPHIDQKEVVKISLSHYEEFLKNSHKPLPEFVFILMDYMICLNPCILGIYKELEDKELQNFLFYVNDHLEDEASKIIDIALLQHLVLEFKRKSDCILKTVTSYVESINPEIVVSLLDVISIASGQEKYLRVLKEDRSLFLNLGCLLQSLHKIGKAGQNMFAPIQKLEVMVPTTNHSADYEKEISYSFKTKLVKTIANLSYRNKKNQEFAREMDIMLSIFECSNADARNPLIKEWSILAIRNLCEDNDENQEMIRNLTKVGDAENPLLKEFGLDTGTIRIKKPNN
ncbi:unnamed protein product [Diamesa hyperborea]